MASSFVGVERARRANLMERMQSFVVPALVVIHHVSDVVENLSDVMEVNRFSTDRTVLTLLDFLGIGVIDIAAAVWDQLVKPVPHSPSTVFQ